MCVATQGLANWFSHSNKALRLCISVPFGSKRHGQYFIRSNWYKQRGCKPCAESKYRCTFLHLHLGLNVRQRIDQISFISGMDFWWYLVSNPCWRQNYFLLLACDQSLIASKTHIRKNNCHFYDLLPISTPFLLNGIAIKRSSRCSAFRSLIYLDPYLFRSQLRQKQQGTCHDPIRTSFNPSGGLGVSPGGRNTGTPWVPPHPGATRLPQGPWRGLPGRHLRWGERGGAAGAEVPVPNGPRRRLALRHGGGAAVGGGVPGAVHPGLGPRRRQADPLRRRGEVGPGAWRGMGRQRGGGGGGGGGRAGVMGVLGWGGRAEAMRGWAVVR